MSMFDIACIVRVLKRRSLNIGAFLGWTVMTRVCSRKDRQYLSSIIVCSVWRTPMSECLHRSAHAVDLWLPVSTLHIMIFIVLLIWIVESFSQQLRLSAVQNFRSVFSFRQIKIRLWSSWNVWPPYLYNCVLTVSKRFTNSLREECHRCTLIIWGHPEESLVRSGLSEQICISTL